jgi:hypothetical protein
VEIQLGPARQQRLQEFRINREIHHRQVTPISGEKMFEHDNEKAGAAFPIRYQRFIGTGNNSVTEQTRLEPLRDANFLI